MVKFIKLRLRPYDGNAGGGAREAPYCYINIAHISSLNAIHPGRAKTMPEKCYIEMAHPGEDGNAAGTYVMETMDEVLWMIAQAQKGLFR